MAELKESKFNFLLRLSLVPIYGSRLSYPSSVQCRKRYKIELDTILLLVVVGRSLKTP